MKIFSMSAYFFFLSVLMKKKDLYSIYVLDVLSITVHSYPVRIKPLTAINIVSAIDFSILSGKEVIKLSTAISKNGHGNNLPYIMSIFINSHVKIVLKLKSYTS